jgi:hypothetical protein
MHFSQTSRHFISLRAKYSPQHPVLKHPHSVFLNVRDQVSHPCRITGKIIVLYILIVMFLDSRREDKSYGLNGSKYYRVQSKVITSSRKKLFAPKNRGRQIRKTEKHCPRLLVPNNKWNYEYPVALEIKQSDRMKLSSWILNPLFVGANS